MPNSYIAPEQSEQLQFPSAFTIGLLVAFTELNHS